MARHGAETLLLKRGQRGATVLRGGDQAHAEAFPVTATDPTGAGDSFGGAVLSALIRGAPLHDAVRWGCAVASFTVEAMGLTGLLRADLAAVRTRAARLGLNDAPWLDGAPLPGATNGAPA